MKKKTLCKRCRKRPVAERGMICEWCEADAAPYLKQKKDKPTEKVGGIRI